MIIVEKLILLYENYSKSNNIRIMLFLCFNKYWEKRFCNCQYLYLICFMEFEKKIALLRGENEEVKFFETSID